MVETQQLENVCGHLEQYSIIYIYTGIMEG
jgi:hypothetical protein